jgi:hypothetical protein
MILRFRKLEEIQVNKEVYKERDKNLIIILTEKARSQSSNYLLTQREVSAP